MSAIELYERLFYVFAGTGALSLVLSIFLFIRFEIPQTYAMLSGKARRKSIQEIEKHSVKSGKLRQHSKSHAEKGHTAHTAKRKQTGGQSARPAPAGKTGRTANTGRTERTTQREAPRETRRPRPVPRPAPEERPETEVLSVPAMETVMLSKPTRITEELARTEMLKPVQETNFYFQMTENTISIHTDEII